MIGKVELEVAISKTPASNIPKPLVEGNNVDEEAITKAVRDRETEIQQYVPGYRLKSDPIFDDNQVTLFVEVEGAGDFLPVYSGNLDIMTASAVGVAEALVVNLLSNEKAGGNQ